MTNYVASTNGNKKYHAEHYDGTNGAAIMSWCSTNSVYTSGLLREAGGVLYATLKGESKGAQVNAIPGISAFEAEVPANTTLLFGIAMYGGYDYGFFLVADADVANMLWELA